MAMAMKGEGDVMLDINMTPLIDVLLVLLTLLIITLPIQTHAVKLDMPIPNQKPPLIQPIVVNLVVDWTGGPWILTSRMHRNKTRSPKSTLIRTNLRNTTLSQRCLRTRNVSVLRRSGLPVSTST
jgi:biopolymer transport protein ExbD